MQGCDTFKEIKLRNCPENFIITAGLDATTTYGIEFTNKFDQKIFIEAETDGDGVLTLPVDDEHSLAKDFFRGFSGAWELRLFAYDEDDNPVSENLCDGSEYLVLIFEETEPLPDPNNAVITITCAEV